MSELDHLKWRSRAKTKFPDTINDFFPSTIEVFLVKLEAKRGDGCLAKTI